MTGSIMAYCVFLGVFIDKSIRAVSFSLANVDFDLGVGYFVSRAHLVTGAKN